MGRWDRGLGVREGGMGVIVVGFFFLAAAGPPMLWLFLTSLVPM